ncbi:MAG: EF-hand domain-containing protein, partial [Thiobacillus sp.]|nr:EF-hand domain-containing protein [Thiobacillus sp.]
VGTAFAATLAAPVASAASNSFALSSLASGYQVADNTPAKPMDGKCGGNMNMKTGEAKCGMSMADANKDGKISKEEADKMHESMFTQMDTNKDGSIDKTEMGKMMDGKCGEGKCGAKVMEGKCGAAK